MISAPIPADEPERLAALRRYCVLDTAPEPAFDRLTRVVQHILDVPTVLVSLVDADRQWFKSRIGLEATETPRSVSFCSYAVFHRETLIVPDATQDARFADNPLVAGPPNLRFYTGAPLITADGFALGTICAIDYVPRPVPNDADLQILRILADAVVDALELRASSAALARREHELSEQTQLLQTVMDSTSQGISAFDGDLKLIAWNCKFIELLGLPQDLARTGTDVRAVASDIVRRGYYGPGDPETRMAALVRGVRKSRSHQAELVRPEDGRIIAVNGVPVSGGGRVTTYTDVTDERRAAEELRQRLAEREQMARLKNEFLSTVSHELRTPLTSIAGMLELLDAEVVGALPAEAKEMVNVAYNNSQRLIRLINDILDIEKMESGSMPFHLAPLALVPLVERAVTETAPFAQGFGVDVEVQSRTTEPVALVDPDRLIQVLTNLVSNAAKFSPKGGKVVVTLDRLDSGIRISVADQGRGIPETFRGRIFEKFAQADSSDSRRGAGTGLGLAIVKKIVEHLNGTVSFDTEIGRGTTFHVDLPEWKSGDATGAAASSQAA